MNTADHLAGAPALQAALRARIAKFDEQLKRGKCDKALDTLSRASETLGALRALLDSVGPDVDPAFLKIVTQEHKDGEVELHIRIDRYFHTCVSPASQV